MNFQKACKILEINNNHNIDYTKGEHLLAFFSTSCIHCLKASYELSITQKKIDLPQITVFFVGDKEVIPSFFEKSKIHCPNLKIQNYF